MPHFRGRRSPGGRWVAPACLVTPHGPSPRDGVRLAPQCWRRTAPDPTWPPSFPRAGTWVCFPCLRDTLEKLHSMDDAFRKQVDAIVAAHQAEIVKMASEKQKHIDSANLKVL